MRGPQVWIALRPRAKQRRNQPPHYVSTVPHTPSQRRRPQTEDKCEVTDPKSGSYQMTKCSATASYISIHHVQASPSPRQARDQMGARCSDGCVERKRDGEEQNEVPAHDHRPARSEPRALNGATHVWRAAAARRQRSSEFTLYTDYIQGSSAVSC